MRQVLTGFAIAATSVAVTQAFVIGGEGVSAQARADHKGKQQRERHRARCLLPLPHRVDCRPEFEASMDRLLPDGLPGMAKRLGDVCGLPEDKKLGKSGVASWSAT